jgi:2-octaprenyl-6-methoxyphenol hydroxylase
MERANGTTRKRCKSRCAGRRRRLCRPGRRRVDQAGAPNLAVASSMPPRPAPGKGRPRFGHRRRRLPHARPARRLGRDRAEAQAITEMIITDSKTSDPVRPVFLTFDGEVGAGRALCPYGRQQGAERRAARAAPNSASTSSKASPPGFRRPTIAGITVHLADGATHRRPAAGRRRRRQLEAARHGRHQDGAWEYGQSGIVCTVAHERPHNGRAEEHFLPAGPFATLPLKPTRTAPTAPRSSGSSARGCRQAGRGRRSRLRDELEQRFGLKLGEIRVADKPRAWPLGLTWRAPSSPRASRSPATPPTASTRSPARASISASRMQQRLPKPSSRPTGSARTSARSTCSNATSTWRRFDTVRMGVTTDVLNRLFSNDIGPLRTVRDIGLGLVERMPRLKDFFIRQASGLSAGNAAPVEGRSDLRQRQRSALPPRRPGRLWRPKARAPPVCATVCAESIRAHGRPHLQLHLQLRSSNEPDTTRMRHRPTNRAK